MGGLKMVKKCFPRKKISTQGNSIYTASEINTHLSTKHYPVVIFDLTGVIFRVRKTPFLKKLGYHKYLWYCIQNKQDPRNLFKILFTLLDRAFPHDQSFNYTYKQDKMPQLIYNWCTGKMNSKEIIALCSEAFNRFEQDGFFTSHLEKEIYNTAMNTFFDPAFLTETVLTKIPETVALMRSLAKNHKLYLLSNLDKESFALLQKKYPAIFNLFDGLMISAQAGYLKPDAEIYHEFLTRFNLNPIECFFIDDQEDNIVAAKKFGINGTVFIE